MNINDNYFLLAQAIITQATEEYKNQVRGLPLGIRQNFRMVALENFFRSEWFDLLSGGLDPDYLLDKLRKEAKYEVRRNIKNQ